MTQRLAQSKDGMAVLPDILASDLPVSVIAQERLADWSSMARGAFAVGLSLVRRAAFEVRADVCEGFGR
jgi:hypothetical protein